ncbi:MAG TPA: hypothetical protein DCS93_38000 [Microscillaceae bacterium]|nr:hypothetical protein [Microscillaceae bacterium]
MEEANQSEEEKASWDTYIASYEDGKPGITTLRMDLIEYAPVEEFPQLLVIGFAFEGQPDSGFPKEEERDKIYEIDDAILEFMSDNTDGIHVGSFTYDGKRLSYFYLNEVKDIETQLDNFSNTQLPEVELFVDQEEDKAWDSYLKFLYPSDDILHYMYDRDVVMQLEKHGDPLVTPRRVDHWVYFENMDDLGRFSAEVAKLGFQTEGINETNQGEHPYQLTLWREDAVELDTIYEVTSELREMAQQFKGAYDGWETSVVNPEG